MTLLCGVILVILVVVYVRNSVCVNKCMKAFFGYRKYDSVTNMLLVLGLPSCDTIWHNAKVVFSVSAVDSRIFHVFFR